MSPAEDFMTTHKSSLRPLAPARLEQLAAAYAAEMLQRRWYAVGCGLVLLVCIGLAAFASEVQPLRFAENLWRFPNYVLQLVPTLRWTTLGADFAEWFWGWKLWLKLLAETLLIAYLGTVIGAVGAFVLSFLAARNVARSKTSAFMAKRFLEICRTVPEIVFALIFVIAFGLGPIPGVMALAIHTFGALGKQFGEVIENIDMRPVEGVSAAGAGWTETMRYAVLPQVASNFVSYGLLRFEMNVRGAAIMGFVGAGGIGQELLTAIRKFYYSDISALLLMLIATVMIIDLATERVRHRLIGIEARA
jgi:phosphonate transport system permease protein